MCEERIVFKYHEICIDQWNAVMIELFTKFMSPYGLRIFFFAKLYFVLLYGQIETFGKKYGYLGCTRSNFRLGCSHNYVSWRVRQKMLSNLRQLRIRCMCTTLHNAWVWYFRKIFWYPFSKRVPFKKRTLLISIL